MRRVQFTGVRLADHSSKVWASGMVGPGRAARTRGTRPSIEFFLSGSAVESFGVTDVGAVPQGGTSGNTLD
jgi:hypothetical protein